MTTKPKTRIYNLIILDESGSMSYVERQTIAGCNEVINVIKASDTKHTDTQENFVSIFAFQDHPNIPSRYLVKNVPAQAAQHITNHDYTPAGATPLYDAIGATLTELRHQTEGIDAIGSVTVITDGMENSSTKFRRHQIVKMIKQLEELGWNFNFIGANINAAETAQSLGMSNSMQWDQTDEGTNRMYAKFSKCRESYGDALNDMTAPCASEEDRREGRRKAARGFFKR